MKKAFVVLLVTAMCVVAVAIPVWYVNGLLIIYQKPLSVTAFGTGENLFHVIPEKELDGAIIVDAKGKKHYVFSEEKLRLIGPKFLAKMAGGNE